MGRPGRGSGGAGRDPSGRGSIPGSTHSRALISQFQRPRRRRPCCHHQRGPTRGWGRGAGQGAAGTNTAASRWGWGEGARAPAAPDQSQAFWEGAAGRPGRKFTFES